MNMFKFLRSNAGRVVIGPMRAAGLLIGASVLGISTWNAANPPEPAKNAPIRSFSQIARGVNHGEGIMVDGSGVQLATAEERARFDGSANNFGLDTEANVANITAGSVVGGAGSPGDAYRFGSSDGLSRDKDASESPSVAAALAQARAANAAQNAGAQAAGARAASKAAQGQGADAKGGNTLQKRSVSGMSGSGGSGLSAVASSGGNVPSAGAVGRSPRIGGADTPALTGPKSISGAMPDSSLMVSSRHMGRSSGFDRAHDGRAGRGGQSAEGRSLLDIAKTSAKIASRSGKGVNKANEAITPFMGGQLSGGLSVDGKEDFSESSGSADFDTPREEKEQNLNNAFDDVDLTEEKREERRKNLLSRMFALILSSLGAMMAVAALVEVAKAASGLGSIFAWIAAGLIVAAQMTAWGFYIAEAAKYNSTYHSGGWLGASIGVSLIVGAGFALTMILGKAAEKGTDGALKLGLKEWLMMGLGGVSAGLGSTQSIIQSRDAIMDYHNDKESMDLGK